MDETEQHQIPLVTQRRRPGHVQRRSPTGSYQDAHDAHIRRQPVRLHRRKMRALYDNFYEEEDIVDDYENFHVCLHEPESQDISDPSILEERPRRTIRPPLTDPAEMYPLYTPNMPALELSGLVGSSPEGDEALSWLNDEEKYRRLLRGFPRRNRRRFHNTQMIPYIAQLLAAHIIEPCDPHDVCCWTKLFCLPEPSKKRHRLIAETRDLNEGWRRAGFPYTSLPQPSDIRSFVLAAESITTGDLRCYYYQLELSKSIRKYFGVQIGEKTFRLCRLPMGACISVYVGHTISCLLHERVTPQVPLKLTYIDNWYSNGDNRRKYEASTAILSENSYGTRVSMLGLIADCTNKTLQLGERFRRHVDLLQSAPNHDMTYRELWRIVGIVMRFVHVANRPLHDMFFLLCLIRRASKAISADDSVWETKINCSPVERKQLQEIAAEAAEMNSYQIIQLDYTRSSIIFTDASEGTWGAVRLSNQKMHISSGPLPAGAIHEGEAIAALNGLRECPRDKPITILVDNTIVAYAIERGHSQNATVNRLCSAIARWSQPVQVAWLPTSQNWADGPSRHKDPRLSVVQPLDLRPAKQWLTVCVAATPQPSTIDLNQI
ncbi:unnamed protein product [Bodo saltans]|uniref:Uncharacterized protein n=1 Tax=Bodo saltans TaxID=75058 RepID=A0A0S4IIP3_BODSA|nr:unnamed protein product [Bodo saltans]|eukprot:CUE72714.1 unnamed protein product [Bodo saltans]